MNDKLAVLNPFARLADETLALRAARAGAIGAWLSAAGGVLVTIQMTLRYDLFVAGVRDRILASADGRDPAATERMLGMIEPTALWAGIGMPLLISAVYVGLGFVQWRRATRFIPLVLLLIAAYGLLASANDLMAGKVSPILTSPFEIGLNWIISLLPLPFLVAGLRGGFRLKALGAAKAGLSSPPSPSPAP